jgi:hypothetical protein
MVSAEIVGVNRVLSLMESMKAGVLDGLRKEMRRQTIALQSTVVRGYLDGHISATVGLKVGKTGHLHRSIAEKVTESGGHFEGIVGTKVNYGVFWETGFDRKVGAGARGGPKSITSAMALAKYHQMHPSGVRHYRRQFLAPALIERTPAIRQALEEAVRKAVGK